MWHIDGLLNSWHCFILLAVTSTRLGQIFVDTVTCQTTSIFCGLLCYHTDVTDTPRSVVPLDDDLKYRILFEAHDSDLGGHWVVK